MPWAIKWITIIQNATRKTKIPNIPVHVEKSVLLPRTKRIEQVRKTLDYLAYASLFFDICIAAITSMSIIGFGGNRTLFLIPINYLLTGVVILSLVSFATLLILKHEETILVKLLRIKKS